MELMCYIPLFCQVTTVDRYQGQQNDYIILSLVRTKTVGHIRDVRRLVVAMSRARLGLYVLARVSLFKNCFELRPAFSQVRKTYLVYELLYLASQRNGFQVREATCTPIQCTRFLTLAWRNSRKIVFSGRNLDLQSIRFEKPFTAVS